MDIQRAQEIMQAKNIIDVQFQGMSVWIDHIDAQNKTARIHKQDNPQNSQTVSLAELQETHKQ
ncbi:H-type small acid-soluble spore protein [Aneurinibacillus terranovensis]|uniref:H-type small acid-soluble spore protein n=1 Tax=Aneurinibacillus terranovensis TaxID=278991 RepID=UPI00041BA8E4|nr:H-type small acid-soluble spore protein [Aneurinibacillus terranovensis]